MSRLPFDRVPENDELIVDLWNPNSEMPRPSASESPCSDHLGCDTGNNRDEDLFERPSSRQSYYSTDNLQRYRSSRSRMQPVKVRLYPFVLDGQQGFYTMAEISRYAAISPSRGTAMLLRRFRLVNDLLDRRHAVGYESRWSCSQSEGHSGCDSTPNQRLWQGHGPSKLRNEIPLADLIEEDEVEKEELSFNVAAECTRALDLFDDSFDFEAAMEPPQDLNEEGDIYDYIATRSVHSFWES